MPWADPSLIGIQAQEIDEFILNQGLEMGSDFLTDWHPGLCASDAGLRSVPRFLFQGFDDSMMGESGD